MKHIFSYSQALRAEARRYLQLKQQQADKAIPWGGHFLEQLEPFVTGGKLLRGSLLCYCYQVYSGQTPNQAVLQAALALELTHSGLLVHDDIMDGDELRRGQPAMHAYYQRLADTKKFHSQQFGSNMAMAGGDAVFFLAFELLARAERELPAANVSGLFVKQLLKTCTGQMQDMYLEADPGLPSKPAIYRLMQAKTAGYTVALPLMMGAALAGQPRPTIRQLQTLGIAAGTIFQIRDDELGALGDPAKTGKPVGSDIKQGKKTLLYYYLYKRCPAAERAFLKNVFGNPTTPPEDIRVVQKLINQHGIPDLLDADIATLEQQALQTIEKLALDEEAKSELASLITFCAERNS